MACGPIVIAANKPAAAVSAVIITRAKRFIGFLHTPTVSFGPTPSFAKR
jgi:hypothetical protein